MLVVLLRFFLKLLLYHLRLLLSCLHDQSQLRSFLLLFVHLLRLSHLLLQERGVLLLHAFLHEPRSEAIH